MNFWKDITSLFQSNKEQHPVPCNQPLSHEILERTEQEQEQYTLWKSSTCKQKMLDYIAQNFKIWKSTPCEQCDCIDFLKTNSFRGFVVHFIDLDEECCDVRHLFDYLKEQVNALGYNTYVSDVKTFQRPRWKERIEHHYLKPKLQFNNEEQQIQRYGNINIELHLRDDEPLHLKFSACFYQDRRFSSPERFEDLIQKLTLG